MSHLKIPLCSFKEAWDSTHPSVVQLGKTHSVGSYLWLHEWNTEKEDYTGRSLLCKVVEVEELDRVELCRVYLIHTETVSRAEPE